MKSFLLITTIILATSFVSLPAKDTKAGRDTKINWITIDQAQELMKNEPKNLFIDVWASWCGWCKVMDKKTFTDSGIINYVNEHYYAVKLDAESSKPVSFKGKTMTERELAKSFDIQGLPAIIFMDQELDKITPVEGYKDPKKFMKTLQRYNR